MSIVIANVIALVASIVILYAGILKSKKKILFMQCLQIFLLSVSGFILRGIIGAITNALGIVRNVLCYHNKLNKVYLLIIYTFVLWPIL